MNTSDFRHAAPDVLVPTLDGPKASLNALQAALANALERIASLERDRDEISQAFKLFNALMDSGGSRDPDILGRQRQK